MVGCRRQTSVWGYVGYRMIAAGTSRERVAAAGVVSLLRGVTGSWLPAAGLPPSGVEGAVGMLFSSGMVGGGGGGVVCG